MAKLNTWLSQLAHQYVLIAIVAVLFFAVKAIIGYYTYHHYNKKLDTLQKQVQELLDSKTNPE